MIFLTINQVKANFIVDFKNKLLMFEYHENCIKFHCIKKLQTNEYEISILTIKLFKFLETQFSMFSILNSHFII